MEGNWLRNTWAKARHTEHEYAGVRLSEVAVVSSEPLWSTTNNPITRTYITTHSGRVIVDVDHTAEEWMEQLGWN